MIKIACPLAYEGEHTYSYMDLGYNNYIFDIMIVGRIMRREIQNHALMIILQ